MGIVKNGNYIDKNRCQEVAERGIMPQDQVRRLTVNALVDTGAGTLVINEKTCEKLWLRIRGTHRGTLYCPKMTAQKLIKQ
jgi:hypothetical protein